AKSVTSDPATARGTANWSKILSTITVKTATAKDTVNGIIPNLVDPMTYEYNLRVQHQFPWNTVLAVQYVGNRSEHEYATEEFNPTNPGSTSRVISSRGRIIIEDNGADSNYNSVQAEIQHKMAHGLDFRFSYTYSKLLDDGSEIFTDSTNNGSTYAEI